MSDASQNSPFRNGELRASPKENLVYYREKTLHLPDVLIRLFACLLDAHPRAVHRKEIREAVWGGTSASDNSVDQTIKRLNLRLFELELEVVNEPSIGYRIDFADEPADAYDEPDIVASSNPHTEMFSGATVQPPVRTTEPQSTVTLPIYTRKEFDRAVAPIEDRLENVEAEVWISGNDNQFIAVALSGFMLDLLRRGRTVRLMGVDPESPAAEMLARIDPRFEGNTFKREVDHVTEAVADWYKAFPKQFEYKLLPILPALGFFITDPRRPSQTVKVEIYTAKPWDPLKSRPHLVIAETAPSWREYFIRQFENYWDLSKSPF